MNLNKCERCTVSSVTEESPEAGEFGFSSQECQASVPRTEFAEEMLPCQGAKKCKFFSNVHMNTTAINSETKKLTCRKKINFRQTITLNP